MLVMSCSCVNPGMPYFRSNRDAPRTRRLAAIFWATVSGEPTYRAPSGPVSASNDSSVGDRKAALRRDQRDDVPPPRPELRLRLLVGGRDVARRVHHHRQRWAVEPLQRPPEQLRVRGEPGG